MNDLALKKKGTIVGDTSDDMVFKIIEDDRFLKDECKGSRTIKLHHFLS